MKTILIILGIVVVAGAAFWFMNSSDDGGIVATPSPTASVQVSPSPAASLSPSPTVSGTRVPSPTPSRSPSPAVSPTSTTHSVNIQGFAFVSQNLTVKKGDKVRFTNKDSVGHSATSLTGAFDSGILAQNQTFELNTATLAPGTYAYKCTPHPSMQGTIIVQ